MKKSEKTQTVTVVINGPNKGAPDHLLARAEIHFHAGLMAGLRIPGLALWKAQGQNGRFISVTFPNQPSEKEDGGVNYYDYIRGKGEDIKRLKAAVVEAYRRYAAENNLEVPEDEAVA